MNNDIFKKSAAIIGRDPCNARQMVENTCTSREHLNCIQYFLLNQNSNGTFYCALLTAQDQIQPKNNLNSVYTIYTRHYVTKLKFCTQHSLGGAFNFLFVSAPYPFEGTQQIVYTRIDLIRFPHFRTQMFSG